MPCFKFLLALAIISVTVAADDINTFTCADTEVKIQDYVLKAEKECEDEVNDEDGTNYLCVEACRFKKYGVLVDEKKPKFDMKKFDEFINVLPKEARDGLSTDGKKCFEDVEPLNNDDNCKSHDGYLTCFIIAFEKHCKLYGSDEDEEEA